MVLLELTPPLLAGAQASSQRGKGRACSWNCLREGLSGLQQLRKQRRGRASGAKVPPTHVGPYRLEESESETGFSLALRCWEVSV